MQTARIAKDQQLTETSLLKLIHQEVVAIIVENYYPQKTANKFANKIIASEKREQYTHEIVDNKKIKQEYFGVDRVGFPFNLIYDKSLDDQLTKDYYQQAALNIALLRKYAAPSLTPIDKLRLDLDEVLGANVASYQNRKMLAGIARISRADLSYLSEIEPHFDALPPKFCDLDQQFAANIYLKVPRVGGELEIWDVPTLTPLSTVPKNWRMKLPKSITIKPKQGDLIIFNCRLPHAIRRFKGPPRVTMQTFLGYKKHQPLYIWN